MNVYELQDLKKSYGERTVLDIASLALTRGKIYTLLGPNGAGKTTLLHLLAFLDVPTSGKIFFSEKAVLQQEKQLRALRRQVVLLDQSPVAFSGTVAANIGFGLKIRKTPAKELQQRVTRAAELVGMESFLASDAQRLSGGENKRVALARALVLRPEVLLCDEPTANVDSEHQEIILEIIKQINLKEKTTVIFSTHYLSQAQRLGHQSLLLQHGRLSDLGSENIFKIQKIATSNQGLICQLSGQFFLRLPLSCKKAMDGATKLHLIPEKILCDFAVAVAESENRFNGHVIAISQQSGKVRLQIDLGLRLFVYLPMDLYLARRPAIGDRITLVIPKEAVAPA